MRAYLVLAGLGATAAFGGAERPAHASPLEDPAEGAMVFTGPATPHASSIFLNPAALGWAGRGWHLVVSSALRLDQVAIDRATLEPSGADDASPSTSTLTPTPTALVAIHTQVLDRGHVGLALHTPYATRFPEAGAALGYHSLGGYLYGTLLSAAGSYQVDRFIFGIGISLSYARVRYEFLRDGALDGGSGDARGLGSDCGDGPCGLEHPAAAERYTLATDFELGTFGLGLLGTDNLGLSIGLAMEIPSLDHWWLTASYVGPPGVISDLRTEGTAAVKPAERDGGRTRRGEAEIKYRMPQSVWLALRGPAVPGWGLVASVRWQDNSRQRELDVRLRGVDLESIAPEWQPRYRGLRDTLQLQLGLEQDEGARFRIGGRLRFESGATTGYTNSPLEVDTHNLGASAGLEWRLAQHLVLTGGYDLTAFLPTDRADSAFDPLGAVACADADHAFGACEAVRDGRGFADATGSYRRLRHVVSFGLRWDSL
jgi:long-subunit fatty acid transport protein